MDRPLLFTTRAVPPGTVYDWVKIIVPAIVVGLLLVLYGGTIERMAELPSSSDFAKFYLSARLLREGENLYTPADKSIVEALGGEVPEEEFVLHPNLNPPFLSALLAPLTLLSYRQAYRVWAWLSLAAGIAAVLLVERMARVGPASLSHPLGAMALMLAYFPTYAAVVFGQLSLFLLLVFVLAWRWVREEHDVAAGVILGVAAGTKLFVALPLLYFLVRRRRRLVAGAAAAGVATLLIGLVAAGPEAYRSYLESTGNVTWYAASWNASLLGFFTRVLGGSENVPLVDAPRLAFGLTLVLSAAAVIVTVRLARPRRGEHPGVEDLGFGLSLVLMLLLSPLGWMYYFPALLPALVVAWGRARTQAMRMLCVAAVLLSGVPQLLVPSEELNDPRMWFTWHGVYFYGLVLMTGVLTWLLVRARTADGH